MFFSSVGYIYYQLPGTFQNDVVHFYSNATSAVSGLSIVDIQSFTEGPLALYLWGNLYDFVQSLGFQKDYSIGLVFNAYLLSLTSVFTMKIGKVIYGNDNQRLSRILLLFQLCGIFYLFSSLHLRDIFVLLVSTVFAYSFLLSFLPGNFLRRIFIFLSFFPFFLFAFYYLRVENIFLPLLYFSSLCISFVWCKRPNPTRFSLRSLSIIGLAIITLLILGSLFFDFISFAITSLSSNSQEYTRVGQEFSSSGSLGDSVILSQPTIIQIPLKILSLFFYPIPIWYGFTVPSAYAFFKSLHLLFNLYYLPLLVLSTLLLSES